MKPFSFFTLLFLCLMSFGQKKQVCFSYDDLPVVNYGVTDSSYQKAITDRLILSLKSSRIPAIGFVNERKLYNERGLIPFQKRMLSCWANNGLELGNHTYSHPDYNKVSFNHYSHDILKGETVTREILSGKGMSLKYFRHPFLHVGNTKEKADSLAVFLSGHGYKVAPVTIDNEDYLFAVAYKRANDKNDTTLGRQIGRDYVRYMERKLNYFEKQSEKLFGRNIAHVLLLHASLLNADYTGALVSMFMRNGYTFVSMDEVLKDPAYQAEVSVYGNWGISWLDRWALSQGKKGDFFKDEPSSPDYIRQLAE